MLSLSCAVVIAVAVYYCYFCSCFYCCCYLVCYCFLLFVCFYHFCSCFCLYFVCYCFPVVCSFVPFLLLFLSDPSISLTASPSMLPKSGSWTTLNYSGVQKPSDDDIIAVYSPTPDKPKIDLNTAPVKMFVSV